MMKENFRPFSREQYLLYDNPMPTSFSNDIESCEPSIASARSLLRFQHQIARRDSHTLHWRWDSLRSSLLREKFDHQQRQFITFEPWSDDWFCHVVARVSPTLKDSTGQPIGTLGFFAAHNEPEIARQLLAKACDWLRERNCQTIIGPLDGDTWHQYRFKRWSVRRKTVSQ